jgi:L-alanine-DL-glutamate epimerase-like enolase superfamily enzyme
MRITAIDVVWLRLPLPKEAADALTDLTYWDFIGAKVATDEGPTGWGYNCTIAEGSEALVTLLRKDLAPRFIGRDPFLVRKHWQEIYLDRFFTGITGVSIQGVAAIEIALWDIIAKASCQPLWRILGGYNDDRIPAYSTDGGWLGFSESQLIANAKSVKAEGFRGFKMKIGKPTLDEDIARVSAVRRVLGPGFPLMVDANGRWDLMTARRAIDALEQFDIYWFEEPLHPFDVAGHAALARATSVPILAGETMYDPRMFRDFLVAGAMGIAQPDVLKLGGISGWMEVAALARAFGLRVVPAGHNMMQLDAHLMAATPHGLMMEHIPWLQPVFERPVRIERGHAVVPREPGAGTDVSIEALRKYRAG